MLNGLNVPSSTISLAELDGGTGVVVVGAVAAGDSGAAVAGADDVDGDGFADVLIGAPGANSAHLLFGTPEGLAPAVELDELDGTNGFVIEGGEAHEQLGAAVAGVGDVNGDGFADLLLGVTNGRVEGESYLIFGREDGFPPSLTLDSLDGDTGAALLGAPVKDLTQSIVAGGGDVNGDGLADLVIGAPFASPGGFAFAGKTYVMFGRDDGFDASLSLTDLDGTDGVVLTGTDFGEQSGASVANAGDVNDDGLDDLLVGTRSGSRAYVVYGEAAGFPAQLSLGSLDGRDGVVLTGNPAVDGPGFEVAGIGDVNGDGIDDIALGAPGAAAAELSGAGRVYVVFGSADGLPADLELAALDGTDGFVLTGAAARDGSGASVAAAGDFNGDGIDDLLLGAPGAARGDERDAGKSYVLFGSREDFPDEIPLAELGEGGGVVIEGAAAGDQAGFAVAGLGDVDGDGDDDLAIGAPLSGENRAGQTHILYGPVPSTATGEVVLAINAGGPALTQDGIDFAADAFFAAGARTYTDNEAANGEQSVFDGTVYKTERFGAAVEYSLPVAPGSYTVELHFAEIWHDAVGDRVFEVLVEGAVVAGDYDIVEATGGDTDETAVLSLPDVRPDDSGDLATLDIALLADIGNAKLSAIVVRGEAESGDRVDDTSLENLDTDPTSVPLDMFL